MKFEFSAGGVVYKKEDDKIFILVGQHSGHKGWVFPKGLIGDHKEGEKKEDTAVREVKEETGIEGKIEKELSPITYWYVWEGEKRRKTVYYYIMRCVGGRLEDHDWEMSEVKWIEKDKVLETLVLQSDTSKVSLENKERKQQITDYYL